MSWESQGVALLTASVVRPFRAGGGCVVDSSPPEGPAPGMTARGLDAIRFTLRTASRRYLARLSGSAAPEWYGLLSPGIGKRRATTNC
jgi:hypothetical protein